MQLGAACCGAFAPRCLAGSCLLAVSSGASCRTRALTDHQHIGRAPAPVLVACACAAHACWCVASHVCGGHDSQLKGHADACGATLHSSILSGKARLRSTGGR
eukprot:366328-Chlamydomonas_euryale.AAC.16